MLKLFRFIGLLSQSIFIQFVHIFGIVAFVVAAAMGYFRLPSWTVPIVAVVFGVIADTYIDESAVTAVLQKASAANKRGGFLLFAYFTIMAFGYVAGAYGRNWRKKQEASAPASSSAPEENPEPEKKDDSPSV